MLKDEVKGSRSRLCELEADRSKLLCTVKEAEQEMQRVKHTSTSERNLVESLRREHKKRCEELCCEVDSLRKYGEHQERKCHELEDRLNRTQTQLEGAVHCKDIAERELCEQAAK